jgi:hypothetical protein
MSRLISAPETSAGPVGLRAVASGGVIGAAWRLAAKRARTLAASRTSRVYFYDEEDEQLIRRLLVRFSKERERAHESAKPVELPGKGDEPSWIVTQTPAVPIPGKWSFCKVRRTLTQKDFGRRDPEIVELFERYSRYTAKAPRPFTTWLKEQAMKKELGF